MFTMLSSHSHHCEDKSIFRRITAYFSIASTKLDVFGCFCELLDLVNGDLLRNLLNPPQACQMTSETLTEIAEIIEKNCTLKILLLFVISKHPLSFPVLF